MTASEATMGAGDVERAVAASDETWRAWQKVGITAQNVEAAKRSAMRAALSVLPDRYRAGLERAKGIIDSVEVELSLSGDELKSLGAMCASDAVDTELASLPPSDVAREDKRCYDEMLERQRFEAEEAECLRMVLDNHGVPHGSKIGSYSLVGRVMRFGEMCADGDAVATPLPPAPDPS